MDSRPHGPLPDFVNRFFGRMRFPALFVALVVLFVADLLIPDPVPILDEVVLALLTLVVARWRERPSEGAPDAVDPSSLLEDRD